MLKQIEFKRKIGKSGNSIIVVLPKELIECLNFKTGMNVKIKINDENSILIFK